MEENINDEFEVLVDFARVSGANEVADRLENLLLKKRKETLKTCFLISGLTFIASLTNLVGFFTREIEIIHPLLSLILLFCSSGFIILSIMKFEDLKKGAKNDFGRCGKNDSQCNRSM